MADKAKSYIRSFLQSEISFYVAIVGAVFAFATFYFGMSVKIELIAQKLETHIISTEYQTQQMAINTTRIAVLESKLK